MFVLQPAGEAGSKEGSEDRQDRKAQDAGPVDGKSRGVGTKARRPN